MSGPFDLSRTQPNPQAAVEMVRGRSAQWEMAASDKPKGQRSRGPSGGRRHHFENAQDLRTAH